MFELSEVGRGAAFGDIDNDGDTDVVVANNNGQPRLLINNVGKPQSLDRAAARRKPATRPSTACDAGARRRDMLGARVGIVRDDGTTLWRRARSDGSYASANDPRVLVGLGQSAHAARIQVIWPGGKTEEWNAAAVDRYITLREGEGK